jgi:hypothetical protein
VRRDRARRSVKVYDVRSVTSDLRRWPSVRRIFPAVSDSRRDPRALLGTGREGVRTVIRRLATAAAVAVTMVVAVACSSSNKKTTDTPSPTTSGTSVATSQSTTATPTVSSSDAATIEAANRQAVEAAWKRFWQINTQLMRIPAPQLAARIGEVAIGATRTQMLRAVKGFRATHQAQYGYVINRPYWKASVDGKTRAVIYDCMDQSHFGSLYTTTGVKHTVGVAHDNTRAVLVEGTDGIWRVQEIVYLLDQKC